MPVKLTQLSALVQEVSQLDDAPSVVRLIVQRIKELMELPVCSLYLLSEDQGVLVLAATEGLYKSAIGRVKLGLGEGLVGRIASTMHALNLDDAPNNEHFKLIANIGEQPYRRFLGVPLIHLRKLVGVLVVQDNSGSGPFSQEEEAILLTVAAHLAATLALIQQNGWWMPSPKTDGFKRYTGIKAAGGVGIGEIVFVGKHAEQLLGDTDESQADPLLQREQFEAAITDLRQELEKGGARFDESVSTDIATLFSVYRMMLDSPEFIGAIRSLLGSGTGSFAAVRQVTEQLAGKFRQAEDPYLQARSEDVEHLGARILHYLSGGSKIDINRLGTNLVLAGKLISIADLSQFPLDRIKGMLCTGGSVLSHTAIVANALGVPAVMGLSSLDPAKTAGELVIVDGNRGVCITQPPEPMLLAYRELLDQLHLLDRSLMVLKDKPAITQDGFTVKLLANTGLLADVSPGQRNGAEGIGLYRSEIPFMVRENFPAEEEQLLTYREVLNAYAPKPVCMRLLDIGGDKPLPYYEIKEDNPYLGWRGIRFDLDNTSILISQIRAMIRASIGLDNLRILVPMVSRIDEVTAIRKLVDQVVDELRTDGQDVKSPLLGIMLEVPSAMMMIAQMAELVDFVSVGTNDLTQYMLAVDRNNPKVSTLFDTLHPAMLQALRFIRKQCDAAQLPVSICGEMASDPAAVLVLVALGYDRLSLNAHNIPRIKWLIRAVDRGQLRELLEKILTLRSEQEIRALLDEKLHEVGWHIPQESDSMTQNLA